MRKFFALVLIVVIYGCHQNPAEDPSINLSVHEPLRYGMVTGIKPQKIEYYKQLHARPWLQVLSKIEECNIRNYSIYLQKIEDRYFLFSYFEYVGNNFDADMKKMAADSVTQRWWKETDPCQLPLSEALKQHKIWTGMQEIFHFDSLKQKRIS